MLMPKILVMPGSTRIGSHRITSYNVCYTKLLRNSGLSSNVAGIAPQFTQRRGRSARELAWWIVQPDIQYIWHPNGGQNPGDPTLTYGHAFLAGIRSTMCTTNNASNTEMTAKVSDSPRNWTTSCRRLAPRILRIATSLERPTERAVARFM